MTASDSSVSVSDVLNRQQIGELIPHAGSMLLLDTMDSFTAEQICCRSNSHLSANNPLRQGPHLYSLNGIEYAAQAAALHIALNYRQRPRQGVLASVKQLDCQYQYLDEGATELLIIVKQGLASVAMGLMQYHFRISSTQAAAEDFIVKGQLAIALIAADKEK